MQPYYIPELALDIGSRLLILLSTQIPGLQVLRIFLSNNKGMIIINNIVGSTQFYGAFIYLVAC